MNVELPAQRPSAVFPGISSAFDELEYISLWLAHAR
jgi:hypothetical protein